MRHVIRMPIKDSSKSCGGYYSMIPRLTQTGVAMVLSCKSGLSELDLAEESGRTHTHNFHPCVRANVNAFQSNSISPKMSL